MKRAFLVDESLVIFSPQRWFYRASVDAEDSYGYWLLGKSLYDGLTFEDINISAKDAALALKIDCCQNSNNDASLRNILAAQLFTKAVGVHHAKHYLAVMFEYGVIPYDFSMSAVEREQNLFQEQNALVPNYKRAAELYRSAALDGSIESLHNLGLMYAYGRGVPVNHSRAVDLFRRAASSRHPLSMQYLGLFAMRGWGKPDEIPDFQEALFWFSKA